ncbi:MAG: enoyl-CoA hydratase [Desulfatiglans sp.]|jgi:enoyl-CoA hydratase|nr:enoyl-CoA hydratase [Desulfatiglans sp.]
MSESVILVEKSKGIATVTLNRPNAMNALSFEMRDHLKKVFEELQRDPETEVVIVTGAGRAFCAGLDLKELSTGGLSPDGDEERGRGRSMIEAISRFEGPIIGAINGVAITGGFELALACDVLIASSEARFADTHARLGILPGWGLSQKLPRLIGLNRAKEMSLTGNFISAEKAEAWGLVNRVVPKEELLTVSLALAGDMTSCVPETVRKYKRLIEEGNSMTLADGLELEAKLYEELSTKDLSSGIEARQQGVRKRGREQAQS